MNLLSSQPNGKPPRACSPCFRVKQAAGWLWRKLIVDEEPAQNERIRRRRIDNIMHNVILIEAMRRWELESKHHEVSKHGPMTGD